MPNGSNGPSVHTSDGVKLKEWIETLYEGESKLRNAQYQFLLDKIEQAGIQRLAVAVGVIISMAIILIIEFIVRVNNF